jgi:hypothetical protein
MIGFMTKKTQTNKKNGKERNDKSSILLQLSGAVIGGSLALALYYAYDFGSPVISAWLLSSPSISQVAENQFAKNDLSAYDKRLVETQIRRIAQAAASSIKSDNYINVSSQQNSDIDTLNEDLDNIWKQEMQNAAEITEENENSYNNQTEFEEYLPEEDLEKSEILQDKIKQEETVYSSEISAVPVLPDSGFGVLAILFAAGAGAGIKAIRKHS